MNRTRFSEIILGFKQEKLAVVGDFFLDRLFYINRDWDIPSVETGLTAYQVSHRKYNPGAAGVITNNLSAMGIGQILAVAVMGDDGEAYDLQKGLGDTGVFTDYLVRSPKLFTPTYTKTFMESSGNMEETNRIDLINRMPIPPETEAKLIENLWLLAEKVDAIVCLEQIPRGECGVFTPRVIETLAEIGRRNAARVLVDSRYNIFKFQNAILKCNDLEILRAAFPGEVPKSAAADGAKLNEAVAKICGANTFPAFISCGPRGIIVCDKGKIVKVPTYDVKGPMDICGAGDSAMAGIAAAICAGADPEEAAVIGNLVASIIIQQIGVTGIATKELLEKRFEEYALQENSD